MTEQTLHSDAVNVKNLSDLCGENKNRSPWFKCYPEDWQKATRGLSLELRGAYFDCLCVIYETERAIPSDDSWMAHRLHISTRLWRSIRDKLVALGKLVPCDDGWTNERAQSELVQRRFDRRTKSESASNRERVRRENKEKINENKQSEPQEDHYACASQIPDIRIQIDKPNSLTPEQEGAREGEEEFPHKVFVNCETIRHKHFTISLPAIELGIAGRLQKAEIKTRCLAHALQWASEIESGKLSRDVLPSKIANFLSASLMGEINRDATAKMRDSRSAGVSPKQAAAKALLEKWEARFVEHAQ